MSTLEESCNVEDNETMDLDQAVRFENVCTRVHHWRVGLPEAVHKRLTRHTTSVPTPHKSMRLASCEHSKAL